ncbi:hypothetical protein UB45_10835 [Terrabacter sp. 28]|nr:hypothetical protein UB45_10835 [Terrabacter sp. 28]
MRSPSLRRFLVAAGAVALLIGIALAVARTRSGSPTTVSAGPVTPATRSAVSAPEPTTGTPAGSDPIGDPLAADLQRLRASEPIRPGRTERRITGEAAQQPDLYAAEFVRRLLTQDYRTARAEHLAWVQSEAAQTSEPLVVGLVPEDLRGRLAVYSVSKSGDQTPAVPSPNEWVALGVQDAYTTVQIQRVEEPMAWSTAVSSGRISDPGITGREVSAAVTLHYRKGGRPALATSSVAMTLNIQGPPTRGTWGFVTAVTYSALPVSSS